MLLANGPYCDSKLYNITQLYSHQLSRIKTFPNMANDNQHNFSGIELTTMKYDDGRCAICLGPHINKSVPDCGHVYCYQCLVDWCHIKRECPSCKKPFTYFYHSIRSTKERQVYIPERSATHEPIATNDPEFLRAFDRMLRISEN